MALEPEPYIVTKKEATWLAKALSKDTSREHFTMACIARFSGAVFMVTTDTHRMHVLRLGAPQPQCPLLECNGPADRTEVNRKLIDLKRVLHEAGYGRNTDIAISHDFSEVKVGCVHPVNASHDYWRQVYTPVFPKGITGYPNPVRVIPTTRRPVAELFAINSRFLADATLLTRESAMRTVMWSEDANCKPIVFQPSGENPRWMAVVMPMAWDWGSH